MVVTAGGLTGELVQGVGSCTIALIDDECIVHCAPDTFVPIQHSYMPPAQPGQLMGSPVVTGHVDPLERGSVRTFNSLGLGTVL